MALLKQMERLFLYTEHQVISAYTAMKCEPSKAQGRGGIRPPTATGKLRALCLTVQRRSSARGFKATLHVCKEVQGQYQVRKSLRLRTLAKVQAFEDPSAPAGLLELTFIQRAFSGGESRLAFQVGSDEVRAELLDSLLDFCKSHEQRAPELLGGGSAAVQSDAQPGREATGKAGAASLTAAPSPPETDARAKMLATDWGAVGAAAASADASAAAMWATREDAQLAALLDAVSVGSSSVEELRSHLAAELAALEDATVHEILESGPAAELTLDEMSAALEVLDDLDASLAMFDAKLRHMREDVAAIEERNNQLEVRARNGQLLTRELEGLVGALALAPGAEDALQLLEFKPSNLSTIVAAAWELHHRTQALSADAPPPAPQHSTQGGPALLSAANTLETASTLASTQWGSTLHEQPHVLHVAQEMQGMAAVASRRRQLQALTKVFLDRATDFLALQLQQIASAEVQAVAAAGSSDRLRAPQHDGIHRRASQLQPLLAVVLAMRPGAAAPMQQYYCRAVNALLRKETGAAAKELHKRIAAAEGQAEPELSVKTLEPGRSLDMQRLRSAPTAIGQLEAPQRLPSGLLPTRSMHSRQPSSGAAPKHPGMAVQDAFHAMLITFLPALAAEAQHCVQLMCPGATPAAAAAPVAALLEGVEAAFTGLAEVPRPPKVLPCLPMVATTLLWQGKLAGRPEAAPLLAMLQQCELKLRSAWSDWTAERVAAIQKYDGKSGMSGGIKGMHMLPFVVNFEAVAGRVEELAAQVAQRYGPSPQQAKQSSHLRPSPFESSHAEEQDSSAAPAGSNAADKAAEAPLDPGALRIGEPPGDSANAGAASGASPITAIDGPPQQQQQQSQPSAAVRGMADSLYEQVLTAIVAALEHHAGSDAKHGPRLRLENFAFLQLCLQALSSGANHTARSPVLQRHCTAAAAQRAAALRGYTDQQLEQLKLGSVVQVAQQVQRGEQVEAGEVRQAVAAAAPGLEKRLVAVRQRLQKHFAATSSSLIDVAWGRLEATCVGAWAALEQQVPGVAMPFASADLKAMFSATST